MFKNKLFKYVSLLALAAPIALSNQAFNQSVYAKTTKQAKSNKTIYFDAVNKKLGNGNEFVLTKPTKISFVKITYGPNGVESKIVKTKVLKSGTKLYSFFKGTEGVVNCVYNFKADVPITKDIWPSAVLTNKNAKLVHKYSEKYSYKYTIQQVLHQQY